MLGYNFEDRNISAGNNYYRLEIMDRDGQSQYSDTRVLYFGNEADRITVYPNPAQHSVTISGITAGMKLQLMDATGRIITERTATTVSENIELSGLAAVPYLLQVNGDNGRIKSVKVMKN